MRTLAACALLAVVAPAAVVAADRDRAPRAGDWRRLASPADRTRLRGWRQAWVAGLADARATADGARAIDADPALFDPDRTLEEAMPPPGAYRCRTVKLGRKGGVGLGYVAYDWFRCVVGPDLDPGFVKVDGSQRQVGRLYADTDARAVFLGTLALGDERRAMRYGRDPNRDVAGWVERIGERRWRMVLPFPAFESTLDVVELVPEERGGHERSSRTVHGARSPMIHDGRRTFADVPSQGALGSSHDSYSIPRRHSSLCVAGTMSK